MYLSGSGRRKSFRPRRHMKLPTSGSVDRPLDFPRYRPSDNCRSDIHFLSIGGLDAHTIGVDELLWPLRVRGIFHLCFAIAKQRSAPR